MTLKIIVAVALAAAVACSPVAAGAHEGHDHGKKAKKVKKSKAKQAAIGLRRHAPAGLTVAAARAHRAPGRAEHGLIVPIGLTTR